MLACFEWFAFTAGPLGLDSPGISVCGCSRPWALQLLGCSSLVVSLLGPDKASPGCSPHKESGWASGRPILAPLGCCQPRVGIGSSLCRDSRARGAGSGSIPWAHLGSQSCPANVPWLQGLSLAPWDDTGVLAALGAVLPTPAHSWRFLVEQLAGVSQWIQARGALAPCVRESSPKGNGVCWEGKALENTSEVFLL